MPKKETIVELINNSPITKALRDNNSAIFVESYDDGEINAYLQIENTKYIFGEVEVDDGSTIPVQKRSLTAPDGRTLVLSVIPFNGVEVKGKKIE